jgi:hypothetical protein
MVLKADQQRVRALLAETVTLLCKNGLHYKSEFSIEGLIGITLDKDEIFLVSIKETIKSPNAERMSGDGSGGHVIDPQSISVNRKRRQEANEASLKQEHHTFVDIKPVSVPRSSESSFVPARKNRRIRSPAAAHPQTEPPRESPRGQNANQSSSDIISFSDGLVKSDLLLDASTEEEGPPQRILSSSSTATKNNTSGDIDCEASFHGESSGYQGESSGLQQGESSRGSGAQKFETSSPAQNLLKPENIIEIKEEGDSTDDQSELAGDYSIYDNYSGMMYGGSDADTSQNYGESSGFQMDAQFETDGQDGGRAPAARLNPVSFRFLFYF